MCVCVCVCVCVMCGSVCAVILDVRHLCLDMLRIGTKADVTHV